MRLSYFWADCPDGSHVAVNYAVHEDRVTGSIRRWSPDSRVNVGRKFEIPASELSADGAGRPTMKLEICGEALAVPLDSRAVEEAGLAAKPAA